MSIPALVAMAALMVAAGAHRMSIARPTGVEAFQSHVRDTWDEAPRIVGDWVGSDVPLPTAAVQLLRPNATLNRRFRNLVTGEEINVLAVHCGDSRDMEGHYPPNCYPGSGWVLKSATPIDLMGGTVFGTAYEFVDGKALGGAGLWVAGTFAVKDDETARDMREMRRKTKIGPSRHFGVAQLQVVVSAAATPSRRIAIAEQFYAAYAPLLGAASGSDRTSETGTQRSGR